MIGKGRLLALRVELGKSLQWLRKSQSLTQYQLASIAQLDYRHYQNIESGRVEMKLETLNRICNCLRCDLSVFFRIVEAQPWLDSKSKVKNFGNELYLFYLAQEQAKFTLHSEVRDVLLKWGFSLTQCLRHELDTAPFYCFEINPQEHIAWKNESCRQFLGPQLGQTVGAALSRVFTNGTQAQDGLGVQIPNTTLTSLYYEGIFDYVETGRSGFYVFLGIKPGIHAENRNIALAFMELKEGLEDFVQACETIPQLKESLQYWSDKKKT